MICPYCKEDRVVKVGKIPTVKDGKKQRYQCRECGRTFYDWRMKHGSQNSSEQ